MEELLLDILKSPLETSIQRLEDYLDTENGVKEFMSALINNNIMAYTYMKMKSKDWIALPNRLNMIMNHKNIFYNLIYSSNEQNFNIFCDFLEVLFFNYYCWPGFIDFLVEKKDKRALQVLNSMFKKFTILKRTDRLYTEIIEAVNSCKNMISEFYFSSNPSDDINLLGIFYSLVFQDIHPFFEDNSDKFFTSFCILFKIDELQNVLCEIFNLYILKYPECIDMTRVLGALLTSIKTDTSNFEYIKYQVLLNITRRKNVKALTNFEDVVINAIRVASVLGKNEKEEMTDNSLDYTRNILKNQDVNRGIITEIIENCKNLVGGNWVSKLVTLPIASSADEEILIFLYLSLKIVDDNIIRKCKLVIKNHQSDIFLSFICFRYLIFVKEYDYIDIRYIDRSHPCSFIGMYLLRKHIQIKYPIEVTFLNSLHYDTTQINVSSSHNKDILKQTVDLLVKYITEDIEDEYSTSLLFTIIRNNIELVDDKIYYLLIEFLKKIIVNINSIPACIFLFDTISVIYINRRNTNDMLEIVNTIITEEIIEIYSPTFYLLSLLVLYGENDLSGVYQIITQEALWKTKELLNSLIVLTISLYKKSYCTEEQVDYIISYLRTINEYYSFILIDNTLTHKSQLFITDNIEELFIFNTGLVENNIISIEKYSSLYQDSLKYFIENYISKKNARRVIRSLVTGSRLLNNDSHINNIICKNISNIDYENVPYSIYITFRI